MKSVFFLLATLTLTLTVNSCGASPKRSLRELPSNLTSFVSIDDYRVGPEWGKSKIDSQALATMTPQLQRASKATAFVGLGFSGGATAFALREKDGAVWLATNHHVIGNKAACSKATIKFPHLGISGLKCQKIIGTWKDIDLTVFEIAPTSEANKALILSVAKNFAFDQSIVKGTKMFTAGFGVAGNSLQRNMMGSQDDDCKVFSADDEFRFMKDPDEVNPGPDLVWGFATGCDISHGDSGSAVLNRETGELMGIIFTGKIPKVASVQSRDWLDDAYNTSSENVWKELNFAVPASKINEITGGILE